MHAHSMVFSRCCSGTKTTTIDNLHKMRTFLRQRSNRYMHIAHITQKFIFRCECPLVQQPKQKKKSTESITNRQYRNVYSRIHHSTFMCDIIFASVFQYSLSSSVSITLSFSLSANCFVHHTFRTKMFCETNSFFSAVALFGMFAILRKTKQN